jgi:cathepsin L
VIAVTMVLASLCSSLLLLLAYFTVAQSASSYDVIQKEWDTFKLRYNKTYDNGIEERFRMKIFMENKNRIAKHNALYDKGLISFKLGLNPFADMLRHEFANTMGGFNASLMGKNLQPTATFMKLAHVVMDDEVDWRTKGAVTPVKNQHDCGSCYAFSATGALEGQHFRKTGELKSLSEQNIIDCSKKFGNLGCEGGMMNYAFLYVEDNRGIDTEQSYPYEAEDDKKCRYDKSKRGTTNRGFIDVPESDEEALKQAVATIGPISVAFYIVDDGSFHFYSKGVYENVECSSKLEDLNHGLLVVGYGTTEEGADYWLAKNQWGEYWGEDGYVRLARNRDNACGIATCASYPVL